ncbi:MAG: hypothetical protein INR63_28630, partial [Actinomycetospora chiangmaiensis]|nr:hypothetical protein [Actinomycetospora chiangmaiensis]
GGLLALSAETYSFTGGAHGNTGYRALLWDRKRGQPVAFQALFASWPRTLARLTRAFCPALDAERAKRRGAPVDKADMFGECPKLADQTLLPGGVRGGRFTAVRVLIGPYEAGPYAEGTYELVLPLDPALVTPAWRGAFGR